MRKAAWLLLMVLAAGPGLRMEAQPIILRIAANVPPNSPWDLGLKRLALEFDRVSEGRVRLAFSPNSRVETEPDIIQKMRLGVDGALLTTFGLAELYPDILALSMPSLIRDDADFDAVLAAVGPLISQRLAARYVVLGLSKGGWIRFFSRSPIVYPSDLAGLRISTAPSEEDEIAFMQSLGARVIPGTATDFILQLNSNEVDAICVSPVYVATLWSQLRGRIGYMSSFKVAPFLGALVFDRPSWERIPPDLRPRLESVVRGMALRIGRDSGVLEAEAIASLDGIAVPAEPPDAADRWSQSLGELRGGLMARLFSPDMLETLDSALAKRRRAD